MKTDDYALMKIRTEDILLNSKYKNYTILRPAITFSKNKFQLMSLEADYVAAVGRDVYCCQQKGPNLKL